MKKLITIAFIAMLGCTKVTPSLQNVNTTNNTHTTSSAYFYSADYWLDCAGTTRKNVVVKSTTPLTKLWTRDSLGGYLKLEGKSTDTVYNYKSDGTQNEYCGY